VLRRRIVITFHAEAEGIDADRVVDRLLSDVLEPPNRPPAASPAWPDRRTPALLRPN
jgi:MoxR-like ATPase